MLILILLALAYFSAKIGTENSIPVEMFSSSWFFIIAAHSSAVSHQNEEAIPDLLVTKSGNSSYLYVITGTPIVSRYSKVLGMSKIDLIPPDTTLIRVYDSSVKSAGISNDYSSPLCTPPMPPVTKTLIPTMLARYIVPATVVDPFIFLAITNARSLREHFLKFF